MAVTVAGKNYTQLSSCDASSSGGTWSGVTFTQDADTKKEGSYALSCILKTSGDNTVTFTPTASVNLLNKHLRMWILLTHGGLLNTYTNGGIQFFVTGGGNTGYWKVAGKVSAGETQIYPGGWYNMVIDTSLACDSGTKPTDMTAITALGFRINLTAAGKNAVNTWFDNLIVSDGLVCSGDDAGGYFDFDDIWTTDGEISGVIRKIGGQYFSTGMFEYGDSAANNATKFQAKSQVLVFENRRVLSTLYALNVVDYGGSNATEFILGSKSGTAGIEGCNIRTQDSSQTPKFSVDGVTDTDVDNFKIYGTTFFDAAVTKFPPNATNVEVLNSSWEKCGTVEVNTAVTKYCNFVSSDDDAIKLPATNNTTDCSFISCVNAIEIYQANDYTFSNFTFTNNTYDVNNTSGGTRTVSKTNGSNPTSYTGSTVNFTASFSLTLTDIVEGTQVTIVNSSTRTELHNVTIGGTGSTSYTHSGGETVDILIVHLDYDPNASSIYSLLLPNSSSTIKIQQSDDGNYDNPA